MEYKVIDTELTSIADAIRIKGGTSSQLTFPNGFITAVQNIPTSTIGTKNGSAIASATMNDKLSSNGTATSRSNTNKYGIYVNSVTMSNGSVTLAMYQRYNSTHTGTINGSYTTRVYGANLYDLIGG